MTKHIQFVGHISGIDVLVFATFEPGDPGSAPSLSHAGEEAHGPDVDIISVHYIPKTDAFLGKEINRSQSTPLDISDLYVKTGSDYVLAEVLLTEQAIEEICLDHEYNT
jgi:hypothetical protein